MQTELPMRVTLKRPVLDRSGARAILDCEDWQLDRDVDEGRVVGILDIACPNASRRELRFPTVALAEAREGKRVERTHEELARLIFGLANPLVRARWVYRSLNCKHTHLYELLNAGALKAQRGSVARTGPGGSVVIAWPELVRFIKARRLS